MIGIYKITNPKGNVYIGQSTNIEARFKRYKAGDCKTQIKLHRSLLKYGFINHTFEIIETCKICDLNERERYWQEFYKATSSGNLNCILTKTSTKRGVTSIETRSKMSLARTGVKRPTELIDRLRIINTGSKRSDESKAKMAAAQLGKKRTIESRRKQSEKAKGRPVSLKVMERMKLNNPKSRRGYLQIIVRILHYK